MAAEIARILREDTVRDKQTGLARAGDARRHRHPLSLARQPSRVRERARGGAASRPTSTRGSASSTPTRSRISSALIRFLANPSSELRAAAFLRSRFVRLSDTGARGARRRASRRRSTAPRLRRPALAALADDDRAALEQARRHVPRLAGARGSRAAGGSDRAAAPRDRLRLRAARRAAAAGVGERQEDARPDPPHPEPRLRDARAHRRSPRLADRGRRVERRARGARRRQPDDRPRVQGPRVSRSSSSSTWRKGASGFPRPVRVSGEDVSVGPFVSESDDEERFREREETKRLLYVALTRARDRLYVGTVLKDGALRDGARQPRRTCCRTRSATLFARAAQEPGESIEWTAQSGRAYRFKLCRDLPAVGSPPEAPAAPAQSPDRFLRSRLTDPAAIERVPVTAAPSKSRGCPARRGESTGARRSTRRHARPPALSVRGRGNDSAGSRLGGRDCFVPRARHRRGRRRPSSPARSAAWTAMTSQPDVAPPARCRASGSTSAVLLQRAGRAGRVLRGTIDCLVRRPDGSIVVIEFKTGAPSPAHAGQLDLYVAAARAIFPGVPVQRKVVYRALRSQQCHHWLPSIPFWSMCGGPGHAAAAESCNRPGLSNFLNYATAGLEFPAPVSPAGVTSPDSAQASAALPQNCLFFIDFPAEGNQTRR